jgi:outer membrane protein TolC
MLSVHPHNLKSCRLIFIVLLIWFLAPGAAAQAQREPEPKEASDKAAETRTLLKERHTLLTKIVAHVTARYQAGATDFTGVAQAQRDLLRATLELEEDLEKRIALLQGNEKTAKEAVEVADRKYKSGQSPEVDVLQAKVVLLEVQIELLREKAKLKPRK